MSILRFLSPSLILGGPIRRTPKSINQFETSLPQLKFATSTPTYRKYTSSNSVDKQDNWNVIYHLPLIKWASAFSRLKTYQSGLCVAGIPSTSMLEASEIIPVGSGATFATVGLTGLITLIVGSFVVQNLIGFIYINSSKSKLKIAYVDFWGHRKNKIIEIDDLIPDGAQEKPSRFNFYQKIGFQSNQNFHMKLLHSYGEIKSQEFNTLFY